MTTEAKYTVWDMHPGRGKRKHIVSEETHSFPNPNGDRYLRAVGKKYEELMKQWNGQKWLSQFIFKPGKCRYEVAYEYLNRD